MKNHRFQYGYRRSASKLHKAVGDCLRSSLLQAYKIYQEYPVNKINSNYSSGKEHFDWVILDLKIVIEVHGEQHYRPVTFGGISIQKATELFTEQVARDLLKQVAAEEAGFTYMIIPYNDQDKISEDYILDLLKKNNSSIPIPQKEETSSKDWKSEYRKARAWQEENGVAEKRRAEARERRRAYYLKQKEQLKGK